MRAALRSRILRWTVATAGWVSGVLAVVLEFLNAFDATWLSPFMDTDRAAKVSALISMVKLLLYLALKAHHDRAQAAEPRPPPPDPEEHA